MGRALEESMLVAAYADIIAAEGSPYLRLECQIKSGKYIYTPLKITRCVWDSDFTNNYADEIFIHVVIPKGDLMQYISPYQDDMTMMLKVTKLNNDASELEDGVVIDKTYRAYLDDQVNQPLSASNSIDQSNLEITNLGGLDVVIFRLEELSVEQLRLMRTGITARNVTPMDVAVALLTKNAKAIKLDDDETISGPSIDDGYNGITRSVISIQDGTELLDVPDLLQNELGGIYKDALGFYIMNNHISLWPLYDIDRQSTAKRLLRVFVSPDPRNKVVENTWRIPENSSRTLEVWVSGEIQYEDNSIALMAQYGTSIRNVNPNAVMEGFLTVDNNTVKARATDNNIQFQTQSTVNGRNIVNSVGSTTNIYKLASMQAKSKGALVYVTWNYSLPTQLVPGMAVEMVYDYNGDAREVKGTLLKSFTIIDTLGKGFSVRKFKSTTILVLFIDREDIFLKEYIDEGAVAAVAQPEIEYE